MERRTLYDEETGDQGGGTAVAEVADGGEAAGETAADGVPKFDWNQSLPEGAPDWAKGYKSFQAMVDGRTALLKKLDDQAKEIAKLKPKATKPKGEATTNGKATKPEGEGEGAEAAGETQIEAIDPELAKTFMAAAYEAENGEIDWDVASAVAEKVEAFFPGFDATVVAALAQTLHRMRGVTIEAVKEKAGDANFDYDSFDAFITGEDSPFSAEVVASFSQNGMQGRFGWVEDALAAYKEYVESGAAQARKPAQKRQSTTPRRLGGRPPEMGHDGFKTKDESVRARQEAERSRDSRDLQNWKQKMARTPAHVIAGWNQ